MIHQQHLRDAQNRLQYRHARQTAKAGKHGGEPKTSPRRTVGLGLVRLGLWVLADVGAGTRRAADSSC